MDERAGRASTAAAGRRRRVAGIAAVAVLAAAALGVALVRTGGGGRSGSAVDLALREGRIDEAAHEVDDWLARRPGDPEAHAWAARVALARDRPDEAARSLGRAVELGLPEGGARDVEGMLMARAGRLGEAEGLLGDYLARTAAPSPQAARALAEVGIASFRFGTARAAIDRWKRDAPADPEPYLREAEVGRRIGAEPSALIAAYTGALRRAPDSAAAALGLADALRLDGRHDEAAARFEAYLESHPDDPEALVGAGLNELERGETGSAAGFLGAARRIDPERIEAIDGLAKIAQLAGDEERALALLAEAAEVDPQNPEIPYRRSLLLARLGRAEEAERARRRADELRAEVAHVTELRDALVERPDDVELCVEAARWLIAHGHPEEGVRWAERALTLRPGHPAASRLLAEHYEAIGRPELANYYRLTAESEPDADGP